MSPWILRLLSGFHVALYRVSAGSIGGRIGKSALPVLLLTTTGRKTRKRRIKPLLYLQDGDRYVVVASVGGAPKHPAWYLNLRSNPEATIQIDGRRFAVRAETATPGERARLWPAVTQLYAGYERYQARTSREIPLMILSR